MTDQQALQSKLWAIANELWGKMSPDEYRNYVLGFIFYKYLSEKAVSFAKGSVKLVFLGPFFLTGYAFGYAEEWLRKKMNR